MLLYILFLQAKKKAKEMKFLKSKQVIQEEKEKDRLFTLRVQRDKRRQRVRRQMKKMKKTFNKKWNRKVIYSWHSIANNYLK